MKRFTKKFWHRLERQMKRQERRLSAAHKMRLAPEIDDDWGDMSQAQAQAQEVS